MNDQEYLEFKAAIMRRPLVVRWIAFLTQFKPEEQYEADPSAEHEKWYKTGEELLQQMVSHPDFKQFYKLSYKTFDNVLHFVSYPSDLTCCTKPNKNGRKMISPFGHAVYELHSILQAYCRDKAQARRLILKAGLGRKTVKMITGYRQNGIEYAECGCCRESGGETFVSLSDGRILQWDGDGEMVKADDGWRKF